MGSALQHRPSQGPAALPAQAARGPADQPLGNDAAARGVQGSASCGDDLAADAARIAMAQGELGALLETAVAELRAGLAEQAAAVLGASVDHRAAALFGQAAGDVARGLLASVAGGPIAAWFAGALTRDWTRRVEDVVTRSAPAGRALDSEAIDAFFRDYAGSWRHASYVAADAALAPGDPGIVAKAADSLLWLAHDAVGTVAALRAALLVPLLQFADQTGAGRRLADGQMTGLYNLKVVYELGADGSVTRVTAVGLPVGVPESERPALLDLLGVLEELPCQFVLGDGRLVADASPWGPAVASHVDPTIRRRLEIAGSEGGPDAVDDLRLRAETASDPGERESARRTLDEFVAAAVERHQAEILESFASTTLSDARDAGVRLLGVP